MPAGPHLTADEPSYSAYEYDNHGRAYDPSELNGDQSAASILQSVKEQEAQFEQLTKELEVERQSVATQLEKCKLGSETASMSSISSTDDSFHWRPPPHDSRFEEESETDSKLSGSQLVDSCLRVLQDRGLMNVKDGQVMDYLPPEDGHHQYPASSNMYNSMNSEHSPGGRPYQSVTTSKTYSSAANGSVSMYDRDDAGSPEPGVHSGQQTQTVTVTKVVTTRQVHHTGGSTSSQSQLVPYDTGRDGEPPAYSNYGYSSVHSSHNQLPNSGRPDSPGQHTPRFHSHPQLSHEHERIDSSSHLVTQTEHRQHYMAAGYDDSFDQQMSYREPGVPEPQDRYDPRDEPRDAHNASYDYPPPGSDLDRSYQPPQPQYGAPGGSYQNLPQEGHYSPRAADPYREPMHSGPMDNNGQYSPRGNYPDRLSDRGPPSDIDRYGDRLDGRAPPYGDSSQPPYGHDPGYIDSPRSDRLQGLPPEGRYPGEDPYYSGRDGPYGRPEDGGRLGPPDDNRSQRTTSPAPSSQRGPQPYGSYSHLPPDQEAPMLEDRPAAYEDEVSRGAPPMPLGAPPLQDDYHELTSQPSVDSLTRDQRWRNPDLPEVIEFLSHPSNGIKANAAAYLQHLTYMDDPVKAKTRALGGIPALVDLVNNETPEVHTSACGALRNLSYGKANDENKKAIKNAGGIPSLVRLLRKSTDNDVRELVTGVLWNLSSLAELKKPIIDDGLTVLVNTVVIPHSGWDRNTEPYDTGTIPRDVYWSTVFRNASGVLRNVSSDGAYARQKLRECEGLVDSLMYIVQAAIGKNDIDNKSVENCICVLRNLSYACQEVGDPHYLDKTRNRKEPSKGDSTGCFSGSSSSSSSKKKKDSKSAESKARADGINAPARSAGPYRGQELLWQPEVVHIYLPLLSDCSNPETLEAAAGAVQNLAACSWQPSVVIRATVRKEKGLPIIVELLNLEADRVVCASATALRNLAQDQRNKELIGKYAMKQLVTKLPAENRPQDFPLSDETICAIEATLYEVVKNNVDFAQSLWKEGGIERLMYITKSGLFTAKVVKYASTLLTTMWNFKELQPDYQRAGYKSTDFLGKPVAASSNASRSQPPSANSTLGRPTMTQSGPTTAGYNENTLPYVNRQSVAAANAFPNNSYVEDYSKQQTYDSRDPYGSRDRLPPEEIPMTQMPGSAHNVSHSPVPGYYDTVGSQNMAERQMQALDDYDRRSYNAPPSDVYDPRQQEGPPSQDDYRPPPGGMPPSQDDYRPPPGGMPPSQDDYRLPPGGMPPFSSGQQPQPLEGSYHGSLHGSHHGSHLGSQEPVYARVSKQSIRRQDVDRVDLDRSGGAPDGAGADSWV